MTGRGDKRNRAAAVALSVAAHAGLIFTLYRSPFGQSLRTQWVEPPAPLTVALVQDPRRDDPRPPGGAPAPGPPKPKPEPPKPLTPPPPIPPTTPAPRPPVRPPKVTPPPSVKALPVDPTPAVDPAAIVTEAELSGAITAASGGGAGLGGQGTGAGVGSGAAAGAGQCDMVQRLQAALRRDPDVRAAVTAARRQATNPRAIRIWNGDWIRGEGQAGKGLAGLRQAIIMEVGFAPEACRDRPVRGLVLISFDDGPGAAKIALGSGTWRWTDLLNRRGVRTGA